MGEKSKLKYVFIVFIVLIAIRMIGITNPPLDYSSWRQVDTDSMARNFIDYKFNILYPQLNYDGPMPNYVQLELQVTTFIIACLYKVFGLSPVIGRMVPVTFFMLSCLYLYYLVKRKSGMDAAIFAVLIYGILPINIVYSRNIMPESALMFFIIGGLYYFDLFIDTDKAGCLILSIVFTSLAICTKIPSALIGIPMIYLSFRKYGIRAFKEYKLYIFAIVVLGIPYGYFRWLGTVAEQKFVEGIGTFLMLPNFLTSIFKRESQVYLYQQFIYKVITLPGIILLAAGLIINFRKKVPLYNAWLVSAVLHVIFVDSVIHLDYYLMFITPVIAVFGGIACAKILENRRNTFLIYAAVSVIVLNSVIFMKLVYGVQSQYIEIGNFVSNHTEKGSLIIIDRDSPELFYTSGRKGWRLYGNLLTEENIKKFKDEGAEYLVLSLQKPEGRLKDYLDSSFLKVSIPGGYTMYKLRT